jgi:hypothetical protein
MRYVDDGRLEIDNNAAERPLRAVALGKQELLVHVFGAALENENENENDNEPLGLAIADGESRHCSTRTTRQRRM